MSKVASAAAKVMKDPKASKYEKVAAAVVLTQRNSRASTFSVSEVIKEAWGALHEAGFYGSDSSSLADGIRWLAKERDKAKKVARIKNVTS